MYQDLRQYIKKAVEYMNGMFSDMDNVRNETLKLEFMHDREYTALSLCMYCFYTQTEMFTRTPVVKENIAGVQIAYYPVLEFDNMKFVKRRCEVMPPGIPLPNHVYYLLQEDNRTLYYMHMPTGKIGKLIKTLKPTGKPETMHIKLQSGDVYYAPTIEFKKL